MKAFICLILLYTTAQAQISLLPEPLKPIPELSKATPARPDKFIRNLKLSAYSESQISQLAIILNDQFIKTLLPLKAQAPGCASNQLPAYLMALQTAGRLDECSEIAEKCVGQTTTSKPFLVAALCESSRYNYSKADSFFELATDPKWNTSDDYLENVFQRASYSLYGHHEDLVDGILALIPNANAEEKKMWKALLQLVGEIDTGTIKEDRINQFLKEKIKENSGSFKGLLLSLQIRVDMRKARYEKAIDGLLKHAPEIQNPLFWYFIAYNTLYYGLDQNFSWSRKIYDVYNQYAHPWLNFPLENNTYNYTEIYSSICPQQLVQKSEGPIFEQIKKDLRTGSLNIENALKKLDGIKSQFKQKADFLSTYAGLLALQGNHDQAYKTYWEAHQLCPYYNRANWGLAIEKRYFQYSARPDYEFLNSRIDREMEGRTVPEAISTYIVNWNSLNQNVRNRVSYGARIWLPYMQTLEENKMHSYIKYAYDLLSESPGLSDLRDARIGGGNYPHDNRLWDDVRGVGGDNVVADLAEVYQAVQGDYNLLGHEMAHQFQFLMESIHPFGAQCIVNQYEDASAEKNFPDSYSSQNKEEHFAQGVTYYMVPADSPARFGLNQNWVLTNNKAQFDFIDSIDRARGDFSQIGCALKGPR